MRTNIKSLKILDTISNLGNNIWFMFGDIGNNMYKMSWKIVASYFSTIESGVFTLSEDGLTATGGTLTNPGANPTLRISTTKKLKLWQGLVFGGGTPTYSTFFTKGISDGINENIHGNQGALGSYSRITFCIDIANAGDNGWKGNISAISDNYYDITFIIIGTGLAITGQWHGTMGQ